MLTQLICSCTHIAVGKHLVHHVQSRTYKNKMHMAHWTGEARPERERLD